MYNLCAIKPKEEGGENLIKKDNLDNAFAKLNLMMTEDIKFKTILIPLQHTPISSGGTNIDMFSGKYNETFTVGPTFKIGIDISIGCLEQGDIIKIEPLKVNDSHIHVVDLYGLEERTESIDLDFKEALKMNQFSDIYLEGRRDYGVVKLSNIIFSGNENELSYSESVYITGTFVRLGYLYEVEIRIPPAEQPTITIKTYQLTPTT